MRAFLVGSVLLGFLVTGGIVACGDDDAAPAAPAPGDDDGDAAPAAYTGPAKGGVLATKDGESDFQPNTDLDGGSGDGMAAPLPCCNITFSLADDAGAETTAFLRGDPPLDADGGVKLAYGAGAWSATACITVQDYVRYRFFFGQVPEVPGGETMIDDNRVSPDQPQIDDGAGGKYNTFGPVTACSDVDAAVGP